MLNSSVDNSVLAAKKIWFIWKLCIQKNLYWLPGGFFPTPTTYGRKEYFELTSQLAVNELIDVFNAKHYAAEQVATVLEAGAQF